MWWYALSCRARFAAMMTSAYLEGTTCVRSSSFGWIMLPRDESCGGGPAALPPGDLRAHRSVELRRGPRRLVVQDHVVELAALAPLLPRDREPHVDVAGALGGADPEPALELRQRRIDEDQAGVGTPPAD